MRVGTVEGDVNTSNFSFRATEEVKKFDFVSVKSNDKWILAQVEEVTKQASGETHAEANIIGYRDKGMTKAPRRVIEPDSIVYMADQELISETLGLEDEGLRIGSLETNDEIGIRVNADDFYKHFAVLAQTGAGKSYTVGVLIEEMLENDFPVVVLDPHGEYSSLSHENPESDSPKAYPVTEYSPNTDVNSEARPLRFSSVNLDKKELMTLIPDSLTNSQMGVLYNALKRLKEGGDDYNLLDIEDAVSQEDSTAKWNLLNYLEQLEESGLFAENAVDLEGLVEKGRASVINLKAVEPDATEMTAYKLAKELFELRKKDRIPPFVMVLEEAHNFVPEQSYGKALSNEILRKIASEGRKFGLGLGVISQRPARIDKNVLSQCNTQFILRVTNPNDLKAISRSFEGITSGVEDMIKSLPPGVCFLLGNEYPVMTDIRIRRSMHGGETQTADTYTEKKEVEVIKPRETIHSVEDRLGVELEEAFYPLYLKQENREKKLVDGVNGEVKATQAVPGDDEAQVLEKMRSGLEKSEIVEETEFSPGRVASLTESLREKGLVEDGEPVESVIDREREEKTVEAEALIEFEKEMEGERLRYPYFRSDDRVYDPVVGKEI